MRIEDHPILGRREKGKPVTVLINGKEYQAMEGEVIAAVMLDSGLMVHRHTARRNEPRGIYCGIGQCTDCVMTVNGMPNVRTCVTPVEDGMTIETQQGFGKPVPHAP